MKQPRKRKNGGKTGLAVATPSEESQKDVVKKFGNIDKVRKESDKLFKDIIKEYVNNKNQEYRCTDITVHDGGVDTLVNEITTAIKYERKVNSKTIGEKIKPYNAIAGLLGIVS